MFARQSRGEKVFAIFNGLLLSGLIVLTLYPLLYVLFASFSDPTAVVQNRGLLLGPVGFNLSAYRFVFTNPMISVGYRNTLFYVIGGTALNMVLTCLGAYALSRRNVLWKKPVMFLIVFTMFFSGGLVPTYLLVTRTLGLLDSPWAIILPSAISTWNLIILRTSFQNLPEALEDAARVDGANDLPDPAAGDLAPVDAGARGHDPVLLSGHWNAFFNAMIYLRTRTLFPLQLILREILITNSTDSMTTGISAADIMPIGETIKYATIMVATVPILLIYPFLQRYFVKGVMIGAIKE